MRSSVSMTASFAPPWSGPQSARDSGADGGVQVGVGAAHQPHRRGRGVLLVIGMQDEKQVECLGHVWIHLVRLGRHGEHHVQQVRRVAEVVARVDVGLADRLLERPGGQRRQLGDQAVDRHLDRVRVEDLLAVGVEGAHADRAGGEDRHRMRIGRERVEEVPHLLADEGVMVTSATNRSSCSRVGSSPQMRRYATSRKVECSASCSIG